MSKRSRKVTSRRRFTPVAAVCEPGNVQPLVEDERAPKHYRPLTQREKDEAYPQIDERSRKKAVEALDLWEWEVVELDEAETDKERYKALKKGRKKCEDESGRKESQGSRWLRDFFALPMQTRSPRAGFAVLFAAILAQLSAVVPKAAAKIRSIHCEGDDVDAVRVILECVNGPAKRRGEDYTLRRPFWLEAQRGTITSAGYSTSPYVYLGGELKTAGKKRSFWLPLWNCAVAILDDLPDTIRALIEGWTTVFPIYCGSGYKYRPDSSILGVDDLRVDAESVKKAGEGALFIHALIRVFTHSLRKHPKRAEEIFSGMCGYLPEQYSKGGGMFKPSAEQSFFVAGLCIYGALLDFLAGRGWLTAEECRAMFLAARKAILPEDTRRELMEKGAAIGSWDKAETFWRFLAPWLDEQIDKGAVSFSGKPCGRDMIVAIHAMKNGHQGSKSTEPLVIIPRSILVNEYKAFLAGYGVETAWSEAEFTRVSLSWKIEGMKNGGRDPGWKHAFYRKGEYPGGSERESVICFGIPIAKLPDEIKAIIDKARIAASYENTKGGDIIG